MFRDALAFDQPYLCTWNSKNANVKSAIDVCTGAISCGLESEFCPALPRSWHMEFLTNITASNVDKSLDAMLSQSYNISNHAFSVRYYKRDCKTELVHSIYQKTNVITGDEAHHGFVQIDSSAVLNSSEVFHEDRDGIYNGDKNGGNVALCIRNDLFLTDEKNISMNFLEKKVNLTLNLATAGFSFDADSHRTDASENEKIYVDYSKYVEAYQCDPSNAGDTNYEGTYMQGSVLHICVKSKNSQVIDVVTLTNLVVEQDVDNDSGESFQYITDGVYDNQITHIDCETNISPIEICIAELNLLAMFFEDANFSSLKVSGDIELAPSSGEEVSRLLLGTARDKHHHASDLSLKEQHIKSETGRFEIDVALVPFKMNQIYSVTSAGAGSRAEMTTMLFLIFVAIAGGIAIFYKF
jgi:hypothetical protein